jgi:hypothetical protein
MHAGLMGLAGSISSIEKRAERSSFFRNKMLSAWYDSIHLLAD